MDIKYILQPVIVLGLLTLVMTVWMFFTRVPAMKKLKIHPQKGQDTRELRQYLPSEVNRVSNNYNHLFEQPTLFYVLCFVIALMGHVDSFFVICAWLYVAIRIFHSLIQATVDIVMYRFGLFILSWLVLAVMLIRESWLLF